MRERSVPAQSAEPPASPRVLRSPAPSQPGAQRRRPPQGIPRAESSGGTGGGPALTKSAASRRSGGAVRLSAAVQVHRTASHERSPPPRLRSEIRWPGGSGPGGPLSCGRKKPRMRCRLRGFFSSMERATGFEPATSTLARLHSTAELRPHRDLDCRQIDRGLSTGGGHWRGTLLDKIPDKNKFRRCPTDRGADYFLNISPTNRKK